MDYADDDTTAVGGQNNCDLITILNSADFEQLLPLTENESRPVKRDRDKARGELKRECMRHTQSAQHARLSHRNDNHHRLRL